MLSDKAVVASGGKTDNLPENGVNPILPGMSLRQALLALRKVGQQNFGESGSGQWPLDDGSVIKVSPVEEDGRCKHPNTQRIRRMKPSKQSVSGYRTYRYYPWGRQRRATRRAGMNYHWTL